MKEIIKKSLVGGLVFSLTSLAVFLVYAATYNLPAKVGTGSGLTATEWNKMVDSIDYLKTTTDTVQTQVNTINTNLISEVWKTPTLLNGWVNLGTTRDSAGYYKDGNNIVHIKGLVFNGTMSQCIFTLPVGYRPITRGIFSIISSNGTTIVGRADILPDGCVLAQNGANSRFSLSGISFRAEQ